jgi:hypothetical protein
VQLEVDLLAPDVFPRQVELPRHRVRVPLEAGGPNDVSRLAVGADDVNARILKSRQDQGCQIFLGTASQNGKKYIK